MDTDSCGDSIPLSDTAGNPNTKTIGREFSFPELVSFAASPVLTQFVLSLLQSIDDGLFLSRYVGQDALASFSICLPLIMLMDAVASLFCGANPYCSILMGEKRDDEACDTFTTVAVSCLALGFVICGLLRLDLDWVLRRLGASDLLIGNAREFMDINLWAFPFTILSTYFNRFYVVAGKPGFTLVTTMINAFCNFFFDWLFICRMRLGIAGAAYADCIATFALVSFGLVAYNSKKMEIRFRKLCRDVTGVLKEVIPYGVPQMFTSLTVSINGMVNNNVVMRIGGETAVAAYSIIDSIRWVFMSTFLGLSSAVCPLTSYAYGEKNRKKLVRALRQIVELIVLLSGIIILGYVFGDSLMMRMYLTKGESPQVEALVAEGLRYAPVGFLFFGFSVLSQDIFNAIDDNPAATTLAILENLVFANLAVLVMPRIYGLPGIWASFAVSEFLTFLFVVYFAVRDRDRYGYGKSGTATKLEE